MKKKLKAKVVVCFCGQKPPHQNFWDCFKIPENLVDRVEDALRNINRYPAKKRAKRKTRK